MITWIFLSSWNDNWIDFYKDISSGMEVDEYIVIGIDSVHVFGIRHISDPESSLLGPQNKFLFRLNNSVY